jgi:ubiquitin-conjugating enzyme E2 variant
MKNVDAKSNLKLAQHDAKELAAGYTGQFRSLEIGSIVTFWALTIALVVRVWPYFPANGHLIMCALVVGYLAADFVSGFVHWLGDTWGSPEMPLLGKTLIRPFREHHVDQRAITRHDYIETNGANCLLSVPVAAIAVLLPFGEGTFQPLAIFTSVSLGAMIFWVMMTNQFHKWAHNTDAERPRLVTLLQRMHVILPPEHHAIHHTAPYDTYYSITTGWWNWTLAKVDFYRHAERFWTSLTGLIPRRDDIGLEAALAIAPVVPSAPPQQQLSGPG